MPYRPRLPRDPAPPCIRDVPSADVPCIHSVFGQRSCPLFGTLLRSRLRVCQQHPTPDLSTPPPYEDDEREQQQPSTGHAQIMQIIYFFKPTKMPCFSVVFGLLILARLTVRGNFDEKVWIRSTSCCNHCCCWCSSTCISCISCHT